MKKTGYKEIFIFITGSTPQVITETIYALAMKKPPVYPDGIFIVTTCKGKALAEKALFDRGILKTLTDEYDLPPIAIKEISFIIPSDCSGNLLDDIRDDAENEAMGDIITSFIREKTKDPSYKLHCSIAGGRKTMSFYLGAALQLFGRPWDKLYHVLVTPEFESNPEFFYKPKRDRIITPLNPPLNKGGDGGIKQLHTKDAEIVLAELPFIRLRDKVSLDGKGFKKLVEEGQKEIDIAMVQPELRVKLADRTIRIGQKKITLSPIQLVIYTAYLRHKLNHCKHPKRPYCLDCSECYPTLLDLATKPALEEMAKDYMILCPSKVDDLLFKYKNGLSLEVLRQSISKIKKAIQIQLEDETLASYYVISTSLRAYSNTRHGIRIEKGKIKIEA